MMQRDDRLPALQQSCRVVLLTQDLDAWGAQRQLVELAKGLARRMYDVRVGTLVPGGPLADELAAHRIPIADFSRRWRWDLSPISRIAEYLRRNSIDVVHSFMFLPNFYGRFAGRLAATPAVVSSLRSTGIEGWPRFVLDVATCFLCDAMIANSVAGATHYARHGGLRSRIVVVPNGMDVEPAALPGRSRRGSDRWGLRRFDNLVGMVGAMEVRKDQRLLIEAMREVVQVKPRTALVLAGDGSQRPQLKQLVRSLDLMDNILFLGKIQPQGLYPLLDVYVQASAFGEGISNSILEAMAQALPVIATDVGGNPEVVISGHTGYIVPPGDRKELANAILSLLDDPTRRFAMGREGQQRVSTVFSPDAMVEATERVYAGVLAKRVTLRKSVAA
jgi:glycosyltransferase involved in cell wall biosynthesis